ncbi:MAG TPA: hypothetical protein VK188_15235 [Holophaga sp.]|nr:hypothetical protein [Holophaga sp.]
MRLLSGLGLLLAFLVSGLLSPRLTWAGMAVAGGPQAAAPGCAGPASRHPASGLEREGADRAKAGAFGRVLQKAPPPGGDGPSPGGTPQAPALWTAEFRLRPGPEPRQAPPDPGGHPPPSGGLEPELGGRRGPPAG